MNFPSSTPFPIQTFQSTGDGPSPRALLNFLQNLISENLHDGRVEQIPNEKHTWVTVIAGLSDYLLSSFPSSREGAWTVLHEKITLVDTTLEVIHRVLSKVDGVWSDSGETAEKAVFRLIGICGVLDTRDDADMQEEEGVLSPRQLRERTFAGTLELIRYLGNVDHVTRGAESRSWETAREIITECVKTSEGGLDLCCTAARLMFAYHRATQRRGDLDISDICVAFPHAAHRVGP